VIRGTTRRARKPHRCDSCDHLIRPGQIYRAIVASPNDPEVGNHGWSRISECDLCARRYGRGHLIDSKEQQA
jgi:hypothetical protein